MDTPTQADESDEAELVNRMVLAYRRDPVTVSHLCDDTLDRSGALLGYLRAVARRRLPLND